jgi:hypothetical protein
MALRTKIDALSVQLRRRLEEAARLPGRSQAQLVQEAVQRLFRGTGTRPPRSIGMLDDPSLDGESVKNWLRGGRKRSAGRD